MADQYLDQLPVVVTAASADILYGEQSNVSKQFTVSLLQTYIVQKIPNNAYVASFLADGVTAQRIIGINVSNNMIIAPDPNVTYVLIGAPSAQGGPTTLLLCHAGNGVWFESGPNDSYGQDIPFLTTDINNNLRVGNNGGAQFGGSTDSNDNYFETQSGKGQYWTENQVKVLALNASILGVRQGLSTTPVFANVGGSLFDDYGACISNVALTTNVVTVTTASNHGFIPGQNVQVTAGTNTAINGGFVIASVPTTTTFTYALTHANITSGADTGTVYLTSLDTNGTEDDLCTHSVLANTLAVGAKIVRMTTVSFIGSATATRRFRNYFGGNITFDTTALTISSTTVGWIEETIIVDSPTSVEWVAKATPASLGAPQRGRITGLTLSANNILKSTGIAAGTGAAAGDITVNMQTVDFKPAATPISFPASLFPTAWLDATKGLFQTAGGSPATNLNAPVGQWIDQSFNGNNLLAPSNGVRPLLQTAYQNGLPGLYFDGVSQIMKASFALAQPCSFYVVAKMIGTTLGETLFDGNANDAMLTYDGSADIDLYAGSFMTGPAITIPGTYTFEAFFSAASSYCTLNNGSKSTGNPGTANPGGLVLGGRFGNSNYCSCVIFEVLAFNRALTTPEKTALFAYLRTKWAHY